MTAGIAQLSAEVCHDLEAPLEHAEVFASIGRDHSRRLVGRLERITLL
jgi:hypothetical protein